MLWNAVIFGPGQYGLVYPECLILESSPSTLFLAHDADPFYPIFLPVDATQSPRHPLSPTTTEPLLLRLLEISNIKADTPFEDGTFKLCLTFDETYPNKPPTVKFISKMFHPNVYANGELCLDILQNRWSPTYDVAAILTSIQSLLHDPNPNRCVPHRAFPDRN